MAKTPRKLQPKHLLIKFVDNLAIKKIKFLVVYRKLLGNVCYYLNICEKMKNS